MHLGAGFGWGTESVAAEQKMRRVPGKVTEVFPADNPSHPHCQDLLTLEQEKDRLSCLVSPGRPRLL